MATSRTSRARAFLASLRARGISVEADTSCGRLTAADLEEIRTIGVDVIEQVLGEMRQASESSPKVAAAVPLTDDEYAALGFIHSQELGAWVFPTGDEAGQAVLAAFARDPSFARRDADARAASRRRQAHGLGIQDPTRPPIEDVEATEISPGTYRWRETGGRLTRVHFRGRRLV